jgi:hypothetical protein
MPEPTSATASREGAGAGNDPSASAGTSASKRGRSEAGSKVDAAALVFVKKVRMGSELKMGASASISVKQARTGIKAEGADAVVAPARKTGRKSHSSSQWPSYQDTRIYTSSRHWSVIPYVRCSCL